jgi:hypothetical protein
LGVPPHACSRRVIVSDPRGRRASRRRGDGRGVPRPRRPARPGRRPQGAAGGRRPRPRPAEAVRARGPRDRRALSPQRPYPTPPLPARHSAPCATYRLEFGPFPGWKTPPSW